MTRTGKALAAAAALALLLAACGSSSTKAKTSGGGATTTTAAGGYYGLATSTTAAAGTAASTADVNVGETKLGKVLVDDKGMTLYALDKDTATTSACNSGCASAWPPLTASASASGSGGAAASVGAGLDKAKVGSITRTDGTTQVTYAGHPLYRFSGDSQPGDTNGQGAGGVWHVVSSAGTPVA
jgi:predicted lipoprotein with Yx(FWY)xxD motif